MLMDVFSQKNNLKWKAAVLPNICDCSRFCNDVSRRGSSQGHTAIPDVRWSGTSESNNVYNTLSHYSVLLDPCCVTFNQRSYKLLCPCPPLWSILPLLLMKLSAAHLSDVSCLIFQGTPVPAECSVLWPTILHPSERHCPMFFCFLLFYSDNPVLGVGSRRTDRCPLIAVEHNSKKGQHSKKARMD